MDYYNLGCIKFKVDLNFYLLFAFIDIIDLNHFNQCQVKNE